MIYNTPQLALVDYNTVQGSVKIAEKIGKKWGGKSQVIYYTPQMAIYCILTPLSLHVNALRGQRVLTMYNKTFFSLSV